MASWAGDGAAAKGKVAGFITVIPARFDVYFHPGQVLVLPKFVDQAHDMLGENSLQDTLFVEITLGGQYAVFAHRILCVVGGQFRIGEVGRSFSFGVKGQSSPDARTLIVGVIGITGWITTNFVVGYPSVSFVEQVRPCPGVYPFGFAQVSSVAGNFVEAHGRNNRWVVDAGVFATVLKILEHTTIRWVIRAFPNMVEPLN